MCTLPCVHQTVQSLLSTLYCAYCTLHTVQFTVYFACCTLPTVEFTVYCAYCTLHTVQFAVYCAYCTLHTVQCTVYCAYCTLHTVEFIVEDEVELIQINSTDEYFWSPTWFHKLVPFFLFFFTDPLPLNQLKNCCIALGQQGSWPHALKVGLLVRVLS